MTPLTAVSVLVAALALSGCGNTDKEALRRAYRNGVKDGKITARADARARVHQAKLRGYSEGFETGTLAITPLNVQAGANYVVTYRRSKLLGWELQRALKMPLGQPWQCFGAASCGPLAEPVSSGSDYGYDYSPAPSAPDYEPSYTPSYPPTTDDFGSGSGYVVTCADGTLSDSGGIQGACSHHGGVP